MRLFLEPASLLLHRFYGWAPKEQRCVEAVPFNKGKNRSVLGAYSFPSAQNPSGLWALWQRLGAWKSATFEQFVEEALLPQLSQGSVLVLDNARIHHGATLKKKVEAAGCRLLYLPPYSPDFNPPPKGFPELVWSWLKHSVRLLAPRTDDQRQQDIQNVSHNLPPNAAKGWFQHCGIL